MIKPILYLNLLGIVLFLAQCQPSQEVVSVENVYNIIPLPKQINEMAGQFRIQPNTIINIQSEALMPVATFFQQKMTLAAGIDLGIQTSQKAQNQSINILLDESITNDEGYHLIVKPEQVLITAKTPQGAFYAIQTIRQLMPSAIESTTTQNKIDWTIPAVEITDEPRFSYRGMHLDVARHFYDVNTVKRFIDYLALHKLNRFHWHLTEDQGWRIEIKQYPKLTEVGAFRDQTLVGHYNDQPHQFDGKRYGGFYTQEEVKEVVAYAANHFITVIPEIELPGHAQAAIAAYPELGCTGEQLKVWQIWGISENVYCPTEATFTFLQNVLSEVIELFPSKYIHIGGDECPKIQWQNSKFCQDLIREKGLKDEHELQSYFIRRIEEFINSKGRQIIGWDEILEGGLAPNATVMSWRGTEGGIEAAKAGHDVIMTPTSNCYFDYYQSNHPEEPLAIGGFLPLEKVYNFEPVPASLTAEEAKYILGAQANIWTEYIQTEDHLEYMAFPRLSAMSEVVWTDKARRSYSNFVQRLLPTYKRYEALGINAANHLYDLNTKVQTNAGKISVGFETLADDAIVYYTTDGTPPTQASKQYEKTIPIDTTTTLSAVAFSPNNYNGRTWSETIHIHKAAGKAITLSTQPHPKYSGNGNSAIVNGILGSNERYGGTEWLGFDGEDVEITVDLEQITDINTISLRFFNGEGQWIYLPQSVNIATSTNGKDYTEVATTNTIKGTEKVITTVLILNDINAQYVKISVKNFGTIPQGRQGGGHKAWLFIDEIQID